ncbi:hypothetical protein Tco_1577668 [Tanacetum coccineum]
MVKISPTNVRLETTVHQKEEIFQVIIDVIKNSTCFKAFTISRCVVDAEVFRKILDICPRVKGEEFIEVQDDDAIFTFLIDTGSNDRLRKSKIDILWGMFYKENVDYPELIWEDFAFQIDHRMEKKSRRETMPFPRFTKEYRLPILKTMLTEGIKQSESYQMSIKYSTGQIPLKKSRGKGSQGKKTADTPKAVVDVSEESNSEPARTRTTNRRVIKKKVKISAADNIIHDPDFALELGKSISLTEAAEKEAARQDTRGPDESIVVFATSSEGTGTKPGVPNEEKVTSEANVILEWGSKQESEYFKEEDDDEMIEWTYDEESDHEFVHGDEQVNDDEDKEMTNDEVEESGNGDAKIFDAAKADAKKTEEVKDGAKKAELPPTSSSLSVSLGFGDQFLKLSSDTSLISTVKDTIDAEINSLLDIKIQSEVPYIQSPFVLTVPVLSQAPTVIDNYLGSILGDTLQKVLQRHAPDLIQKYSVKPVSESSKI